MLQVLERTFAVLEYVGGQSHPVLPAELVDKLKLTQPTAARLLRNLCELGYLEQSAPRKGYRLGPIPFRLATLQRDRNSRFMEEAAPLIRETARRLGQSVLLATRHHHWRVIRLHSNFNTSFSLDLEHLRYFDLYCTVSGRLLLAYASEPELDAITGKLGFPDDRTGSACHWPEAAGSSEKFHAELARIRKAGFLELKRSGCGNFHCAAFPVLRHHKLLGVIAANWPVDSDAQITCGCIDALDALARQLSRHSPVVAIG